MIVTHVLGNLGSQNRASKINREITLIAENIANML